MTTTEQKAAVHQIVIDALTATYGNHERAVLYLAKRLQESQMTLEHCQAMLALRSPFESVEATQ